MTARGRKHAGSRNDDTYAHTAAEWAFTRELRLECPAGHVLGTARQDSAGTSLAPAGRDSDNPNPSPTLEFAGPPDDLMRTFRWVCPLCDRRSRARGNLSRDAKSHRRHEVVARATALLELLEAMSDHGPKFVRVRVDQIADRIPAVISGEQLRVARAFSNNPGKTPIRDR